MHAIIHSIYGSVRLAAKRLGEYSQDSTSGFSAWQCEGVRKFYFKLPVLVMSSGQLHKHTVGSAALCFLNFPGVLMLGKCEIIVGSASGARAYF